MSLNLSLVKIYSLLDQYFSASVYACYWISSYEISTYAPVTTNNTFKVITEYSALKKLITNLKICQIRHLFVIHFWLALSTTAETTSQATTAEATASQDARGIKEALKIKVNTMKSDLYSLAEIWHTFLWCTVFEGVNTCNKSCCLTIYNFLFSACIFKIYQITRNKKKTPFKNIWLNMTT